MARMPDREFRLAAAAGVSTRISVHDTEENIGKDPVENGSYIVVAPVAGKANLFEIVDCAPFDPRTLIFCAWLGPEAENLDKGSDAWDCFQLSHMIKHTILRGPVVKFDLLHTHS